jgi:PilZ domain
MPSESTVVIAPPDLLSRLVERLRSQDGGELTTCADTDIPAAIERVLAVRPDRVALERLFAATSRGAALLSRLKADPALAHAEFRIVSHDSDYWRISPRRPGPGDAMPSATPQAVTSDAPPLDQHGTRRAARLSIQEGVEVLVDGSPARLVDLSAVGGQVLSSGVLKPNQRVRVSMVDGRVTLRCQATIIWARFELSRGDLGPRYRAGLEFSGADDTDGIAEYARRHQKK